MLKELWILNIIKIPFEIKTLKTKSFLNELILVPFTYFIHIYNKLSLNKQQKSSKISLPFHLLPNIIYPFYYKSIYTSI